MADLIAIAYPDEATAERAAEEARRLAHDLLIQPDAIAVVVRDSEGKIHVHTTHHHQGIGATTWGMFWGLCFGALFFIPVFGLAIGTGLGVLMHKMHNAGIDREFQEQVREKVQPGTSALFLILDRASPEATIAALHEYGGTVLTSPLNEDGERELHEALHGSQTATVT